jgi:hypothetical protein
MMLTTALIAFQLRRFRGWRLTWEASPLGTAGGQFQLSDLLLWTVLISGALGAMRFLHSIDEQIHEQLFEFCRYTAQMTILVAIAAAIALAPRIRLWAVSLAIIGILALGAAFSTVDIYKSLAVTNRFGNRVQAVWGHLKEHETISIAMTITAAINCAVLRTAGCRLVKAGKRNAPQPVGREGTSADAPR